MIRVASYNVQKAIGLDGRRRPDRILDVIEELDPDLIALQEADRRFGDRRAAMPLEMIAHRTDYRVVPLAESTGGIGWHGNALLARRSLRVGFPERWPLPQLEPRGAVSAVIQTAHGAIRLLGMHLSLVRRVRRRQIDFVSARLTEGMADIPTVLLGDFNEWRNLASNLRGLPPGYRLLPVGASFPSILPMSPLDRIIVSPGLTVHAFGVHRTTKSRIASDHLPVWADLSLD